MDIQAGEDAKLLKREDSGAAQKLPLAWHEHCGVYCGARETVGGSSVSSGCWGEDSNHENGWALRPPRCSAHSIYDEAQDSLRFSFFAA